MPNRSVDVPLPCFSALWGYIGSFRKNKVFLHHKRYISNTTSCQQLSKIGVPVPYSNQNVKGKNIQHKRRHIRQHHSDSPSPCQVLLALERKTFVQQIAGTNADSIIKTDGDV
jgi:hypothetical protein